MKLINNSAFWGVLLAIAGGLMLLQSLGLLATAALAWSAIFGGAGLSFLYVFFAGRDVYWWAAIPGFALLGLATLVAWTELGPRSADEWGGALFLGAISLGFWAIYEVNHGRWWAAVPGGVLLTLALVAVLDYAWPAALVLAGLYLIFRAFVPGRSPGRSLGRPSHKGGG